MHLSQYLPRGVGKEGVYFIEMAGFVCALRGPSASKAICAYLLFKLKGTMLKKGA
jgi:hypothetical protein